MKCIKGSGLCLGSGKCWAGAVRLDTISFLFREVQSLGKPAGEHSPHLPAASTCWLSAPPPRSVRTQSSPGNQRQNSEPETKSPGSWIANPWLRPWLPCDSFWGLDPVSIPGAIPAHPLTGGLRDAHVTRKWVVFAGFLWDGTGICVLGPPRPWALTVGQSPRALFPPLDNRRPTFPCGVCLSLRMWRLKHRQAYRDNGFPAGVGSALFPVG